MKATRNTATNFLSLEQAIARLKTSAAVEGIALFGSQVSEIRSPISDYDLLILITRPPVNIFQMLTHIDGRMADVVFVETEVAERVLSLTSPVSPSSFEGLFLLKMQNARIVYDRSGLLQAVQRMVTREKQVSDWLGPSSYSAVYAAWFWQNHSLFHIQRMIQSDDPVYQTAVDMMLLTGLGGLCRAYFNVRNLPWTGEKAAVRFLQDHDPVFLSRFRECIASNDRVRKVSLYHELVEQALAPAGNLWIPGITAVVLRDPEHNVTQIEAALQFWETLLGSEVRTVQDDLP